MYWQDFTNSGVRATSYLISKIGLPICMLALIQIAEAQQVFSDDFGQTTKRRANIFIPSASNNFPNKGYQFADPNGSIDAREIDNDFYAIIDPNNIGDAWPSNQDWFWTGPTPVNASSGLNNPATDDHTPNDVNGAVLVVNGSTTSLTFYQRLVTLQSNSLYRLSVWLYTVNPNNSIALRIFDANNNSVMTAIESPVYSTRQGWFEIPFYFELLNCAITDVKISLVNNFGNPSPGENDFYIDDITLTKIVNAPNGITLEPVNCPTIARSSNAVNDVIILSSGSTSIESVLDNDLLNGVPVVINQILLQTLFSSNPDIQLDPTSGRIIIGNNVPIGTYQLSYGFCDNSVFGNCANAFVSIQVTTALPVKFISFGSKPTSVKCEIELTFTVEEDALIQFYELQEKKSDTEEWKPIITIFPKRNNQSINTYSTKRIISEDAAYYFRMKAQASLQKEKYSNLIFNQCSPESRLIVFPNPIVSQLFLKGLVREHTYTIIQINTGIITHQLQAETNTSTLNFNHLPKGSYLIIEKGNKGEIMQKRTLIKQ